jgi:hypothetical protein
MLFLEAGDMTAYMAKAHEDKLRAINEVEAKKNTEIEVINLESIDELHV